MNPISSQFDTLNPVKSVSVNSDIAGIIKSLGLINLAFFVIGIIFLGNLFAAAYNYINSSGTPEGISKATQRLTNSLLGLAIVFGSFIVVRIVAATVGASGVLPF